jgi:hypothetical protein
MSPNPESDEKTPPIAMIGGVFVAGGGFEPPACR